jgi:LysR family transcriptional regulator, benzoate and cis,cis-muconate-responsive activator of ben and cat genes
LLVGHPTHGDPAWIPTLLRIQLPLFPKLKVRLTTQFALELVRSVLANELHIALVTAPPTDAKITAVPFAEMRLCAVLPEAHAAARKEQVTLQDIANDEWILLPRTVNTVIHDAIIETAARRGIPAKPAHGVINAQQAFCLVSERAGVGILPQPSALGLPENGVVVRPLSDPALSFETCLIMRRDDDSKLVNDFGRAFLRKYVRKLGPGQWNCPYQRNSMTGILTTATLVTRSVAAGDFVSVGNRPLVGGTKHRVWRCLARRGTGFRLKRSCTYSGCV